MGSRRVQEETPRRRRTSDEAVGERCGMSGLEVGAAGGEQRAVFISGLVKKLGSSTGECCMITGLSGFHPQVLGWSLRTLGSSQMIGVSLSFIGGGGGTRIIHEFMLKG